MPSGFNFVPPILVLHWLPLVQWFNLPPESWETYKEVRCDVVMGIPQVFWGLYVQGSSSISVPPLPDMDLIRLFVVLVLVSLFIVLLIIVLLFIVLLFIVLLIIVLLFIVLLIFASGKRVQA